MKHSLVVDLGNTCVKYAVFQHDKFIKQCKIPINEFDFFKSRRTLRLMLKEANLEPSDFEEGILFSVVPSLDSNIKRIVRSVFKLRLKSFHLRHLKELPAGVPEEIGPDLLADIIGGISLYETPLMIADLGTVTKFIFIDKDKKLVGCSFMPGMDASLNAMNRDTELLPSSRFEKPSSPIGFNTIDCMKSGVYYSTIAAFKDFANIAKEKFGNVKTVITGGYSENANQDMNADVYDLYLTVKGMNMIRLELAKNKKD